ncbi:MAG TPA: Wzy polymerase domain-containing protein [Burkholderiales bacterium]|nr:Wzy polymerase domain-containing protein [Burkholderiales bacterium]
MPDPARVSLAFAALLAALPFLFPEHRPPFPSFYDEWVAVSLAALAVAAMLTARRSGKEVLPDLAVWLLLFAAWLALQAALREPAYPQLPIAGIAYLLTAAQLAWLGHALAERCGTQRVVDILAWAILAGAIANAAIGILQFYGVPRFLTGFIATTPGPRIVGHVGQANLFADYMALGQAALLYLVARDRLRGPLWWSVAALLVLSSAYTQSRSAILFSLWIYAAAFSLRHRGAPWKRLARHAGILVLGTLAAMAVVRVSALDRLSGIAGEPRLALWALAWQLFADSPWLGVGWGEFAGAAFGAGLPPLLGVHDGRWTSAHNVVLQALAEAGVIGAALVLIAAVRWWRRAWTDLRSAPTLPLWWVTAAVGTISLHALLEEPLSYAHVLGLAALVAGIASRTTLKFPAVPMRVCLLAANLGAFAALAWSLFDYQRFDRAYVVASGRTLASAEEVAAAVEELRALAHGPLGAQVAPWLFQSLAPANEDPAALVAMGERALRRSPTPEVIARNAAALARAGRLAEATRLVEHALETLPGRRARLESALERAGFPSAPRGALPPPRARRERRAAPPRRPPAARRLPPR